MDLVKAMRDLNQDPNTCIRHGGNCFAPSGATLDITDSETEGKVL